MKKLLSSIFLSLSVLAIVHGQEKPSPAQEVKYTSGDLTVTINYSSPAVKGRTIFGDLVPYGKVWRTGANEATTIEFSKAVTIDTQKIEAGKYGLFTIPGKDEWTIIFNEEANQWGAYSYKADKDVLRVKAKPSATDANVERMTFAVDKGLVTISWADTKVSFKISQ